MAAAIILPMRLGVKHRVLWRIGFAVLCILLVIAGVFVENQIREAKRYNTVEEMIENCISNAQLKDIIYYENYAILFVGEEHRNFMEICTAVTRHTAAITETTNCIRSAVDQMRMTLTGQIK